MSLKKFNILSKSFSYNPSTIQITPLLIPGSIAPEPIKIPLIKLDKDFILSPDKVYYLKIKKDQYGLHCINNVNLFLSIFFIIPSSFKALISLIIALLSTLK